MKSKLCSLFSIASLIIGILTFISAIALLFRGESISGINAGLVIGLLFGSSSLFFINALVFKAKNTNYLALPIEEIKDCKYKVDVDLVKIIVSIFEIVIYIGGSITMAVFTFLNNPPLIMYGSIVLISLPIVFILLDSIIQMAISKELFLISNLKK